MIQILTLTSPDIHLLGTELGNFIQENSLSEKDIVTIQYGVSGNSHCCFLCYKGDEQGSLMTSDERVRVTGLKSKTVQEPTVIE